MTNQTLFDTIVRHLWTQKQRAISGSGQCLYRAPGDLKCAVGCVIPDDKYDPDMDSTGMALGMVTTLSGISQDHYHLLHALQRAHDSSHLWEIDGPGNNMVHCLKSVAGRFHLNTTVLEEVSA